MKLAAKNGRPMDFGCPACTDKVQAGHTFCSTTPEWVVELEEKGAGYRMFLDEPLGWRLVVTDLPQFVDVAPDDVDWADWS